MDNTGVKLLLLNHQCNLCGSNQCVLSGWWIGGILPVLPVCPYGCRLCIRCVNEPVSFHPTQCWPRMGILCTQYVLLRTTASTLQTAYKANSLTHISLDRNILFFFSFTARDCSLREYLHSPESVVQQVLLEPAGFSDWFCPRLKQLLSLKTLFNSAAERLTTDVYGPILASWALQSIRSML